MFCPYCGAEAEGGKFCAVCGSPLPIMPESAVKENAANEGAAKEPVPAPLPWEAPAEPQGYQVPQYAEPQYMEPQYTEPAKAPESGKKKVKALPFILIGAGVLVLAALAVVLFLFVFKKDPTSQVAAAAAKSMVAVKKTEAGQAADELKKSQMKVSVDLSKVLPYYYGYEGTVNVTFSDDMDAGRMFLNLSLALKGKELADLDVYMDEKGLAVQSDTLLGDDAYGLTFETLPDDLKKSIFAPDSGTYYELPEDVYNMLRQLDQSPISLYKEAEGALEELFTEGGQKFLDSLKKNAEITEDEGKLSVGGSRVECKVIKAEADEDATKAIIDDMVAWLKEDGTKKKLERFFNVAAKVTDIAQGGESDQDAEDLMYEFYDELDDTLKDLEREESVIRFYINKENQQLIGFSMDTEGRNSETSLEIVAGPDFENPAEIRITYDDGYNKSVMTYEVTQNTDSTYAAEFTNEYGSYKETYEFEWKKKRGDFTISQDGREMLSGTLEIEDDKITVEIDDAGVSVELEKGAKTPEVPKYKNIVQISEDDFEELVEDIQDEIQNIMRKMR